VSERRFLEWIGVAVPDQVHKAYSADQLAVLSKMSGGMIRELAQLGLLDERDGRFGFRDLASARQIAKLLNDGVRLSEIIRAVSEIRKWLPDAGLSAVRLHAGALSDVQVEQPGGRTDKYGQFVLAVDDARHDPDELFDQAHAAEQMGDSAEAERLYRLLMKSDPTDASAPFNLGNMLRAAARTVEAEAALRAATRANPAFAEAWYNLADLLDDQGRCEAAIECLRKALVVAPDYIDAVFNLALLLQRKGSYAEAADHWRRYLASDRVSEWAARARRSLKFCEISLASDASAQANSDQAA
jgi:tetratricopeptide (TPR) repeat protein